MLQDPCGRQTRVVAPCFVLRLLTFLCFAAFAATASAQSPFYLDVVDIPADDGGMRTSLVLDAQGEPHIGYGIDVGVAGSLWYARRVGGTWAVELIEATGQVANSSIALDSAGVPHIAAFVLGPVPALDALRYGSRTGGTWAMEDVVVGGAGEWQSLALDRNDTPILSYYDGSAALLTFGRRTGPATWTSNFVDLSGNDVGRYTSMALTRDGFAVVSYYDLTAGNLKLARQIPDINPLPLWAIEEVDATNDVGQYTSLALDDREQAAVAYYDVTDTALKYARQTGSGWARETVDFVDDVGQFTSLALDVDNDPHIAYYDATAGRLKYAVKKNGSWSIEVVDDTEDAGSYSSLRVDARNNVAISYGTQNSEALKFATTAITLRTPNGGETWPVGSLRSVAWDAAGAVDVSLSVDGGRTFDVLASGLALSPYEFRVPHAPTRFAMVQVQRAEPMATAESDSLFTISSDIGLLQFQAQPSAQSSSALIQWESDPGPADLSGYRLDRQDHAGADWSTVVPFTTQTQYQDDAAPAGSVYRLFAINGLGTERMIGETTYAGAGGLSAWPLPYRGEGALTLRFPSASGLGGGLAETRVEVFDLRGRKVRQLLSDRLAAGVHTTTWNGRDDAGQPVVSGAYFVRIESGATRQSLKVLVNR